jgi:O-antigen ligase
MLPQGPLGWGLGKFDAHSYYFTVLFETGYPGLMLLLLILVLIFKVGYSLYLEEENRDKRVVARAIVTLLVTICVLNSTGPHTSSHPADIYFWGSAGLLFVLHRLPLFSNTSGYHDKGRLTDAT